MNSIETFYNMALTNSTLSDAFLSENDGDLNDSEERINVDNTYE